MLLLRERRKARSLRCSHFPSGDNHLSWVRANSTMYYIFCSQLALYLREQTWYNES
jgi:hypothetical protein